MTKYISFFNRQETNDVKVYSVLNHNEPGEQDKTATVLQYMPHSQ